MDITKFLISEDTTIEEILRKIDQNGYGIVYVVNGKKLLGVLTDGDIRRYLLRERDFSQKAYRIMNTSYIFLKNEYNKIEDCFFKKNGIHSVPVIDENNRLTKIWFYDGKSAEYKIEIDLPVVIMAGGKGTRLKPYTNVLPKPLIPINEKTITEHILERFIKYGCHDFYMIVNYKKSLIKAYFQEISLDSNLIFIDEDNFMGTGGGLKLLEGKVKSTFILTNCDVLVEANYEKIIESHFENKNILTMVCARTDIQIPYGTVDINENGDVVCLVEKPTYHVISNTGFYVIEPEFLEKIQKGEFVHITDVIQKCINEGKRIGTYLINQENWLDMGQLDELEHMKDVLN